MDVALYQHELREELDRSYDRLTAEAVVGKYESITRDRLAPLFENVKIANFALPPTQWEIIYLILHSTWFGIMRRRNQLHNEANLSGEASEVSLTEFREFVASEERGILRRLDALLES